jgi:hypothetical protein
MMNWLKQPTTLMAGALIVGGVVYWFTNNAALAGSAAVLVLGGMNDNTKDVLTRIEGVEDALRQQPPK